MILINSETIHPQIEELLCLAVSKEKVEMEYHSYLLKSNRMLYGMIKETDIVGCIGIEFVSPSICEIRHIAVDPDSRKQQIGSNMIYFIIEQFQLDSIFAETDKDAVNFYASIGFTVTSLGEKYLGVERFHCVFKKQNYYFSKK
ncbi:GNAT family N-acetyltransferase [Psychrobacillus antarcticus]|uniref:GNAT family N-acetyltransferase n=1 Tax=Psychrobacillus antarcticus TaxID=2879115 RepID=UPI002407C55B|nr:GNAT family N-acetyltransferase [Psychrobacillus antarcticus]